MAIKRTKAASSKMSRVCVICPLSAISEKHRRRHTKENQRSGKRGNGDRIARLAHDGVYERNGDTAHDGAEAPHSDKGDIGFDIVVSDVAETESPVETYPPASKCVEHLGQWRVDIEVILSTDVVTCERSEMNFVKDDLVGM